MSHHLNLSPPRRGRGLLSHKPAWTSGRELYRTWWLGKSMWGGAALGAVLVGFLITLLELTEVIAIVYALGAGNRNTFPAVSGAVSGVAFVGVLSLGVGLALDRVPASVTLATGALLLLAFGGFLFRSTVKSYLRQARALRASKGPAPSEPPEEALGSRALFAGAFTVGAIEMLEAAIVLIALAAGGFGEEAILGFVLGAVVLVGLGLALHTQIRKVKVPSLKWVATSLILSFAVFWFGETLQALGRFSWPSLGPLPVDAWILPLFLAMLVLVRAGVEFRVRQKLQLSDPQLFAA